MAPDTGEIEAAEVDEGSARLGTFGGVFRPTVLTILGVMMYLREGWLVGHAGLLGAALVILAIFTITGATALSLSTITTNIRLGAGGAFAVISQSLGLETGGAIGIPLYLAQALSAALYIYGFSETWIYIFPDHPQWAVLVAVFAAAFVTRVISAKLAFRLQAVVMVAVIVSLASIVFGLADFASETPLRRPQLWGDFEGVSFWELFAVFFPAGTGIMVGASMSGSLGEPRRSIPRGTLAAVAVALGVYLFIAVWYSLVAAPDTLQQLDVLTVVNEAWIGELVLAGILASTFTATLSSMVAAPHVLAALGRYGVLPRGELLARQTSAGEPRNATLVTGVLIAGALSLGSLNNVAVLITMFFLITYLTINLVLLVEQRLGMVSFRPTFRVPLAVPLVGTLTCAIALFIISPAFALIALTIVGLVYGYLVRRRLEQPWETVRSGAFVALADWAAKQIVGSQESNERSWKPDLLIPVTGRAQLEGNFRFLRALAAPKGSLQMVGVLPDSRGAEAAEAAEAEAPEAANPFGQRESTQRIPPPKLPGRGDDKPPTLPKLPRPPAGTDERSPETTQRLGSTSRGTLVGGPQRSLSNAKARFMRALGQVQRDFQADGLFSTSVVVESDSYASGIEMSASVMRGNFFRPNILFGLAHELDTPTIQALIDAADANDMGVALLYRHPDAGLGRERSINVWVRDQSPDWHLGLRLANLDLSVLLGYQLARNWEGELRFLTICDAADNVPLAEDYLAQLVEDARLARYSHDTWVRHGKFLDQVTRAPRADLNVFGLARTVEPGFLGEMVTRCQSSCLFVRDSGHESALA